MSPLDYPFTPVPDRAGLALQAREIDRDDYAILGYLYRRADRDRPNLLDGDGRRFFPARQSLEQVAEGVRWTRSLDALSKRIRRLGERGWLAYDPVTGRGARYDFRLYSESRSDFVPSFPSDDAPTSSEPETAGQSGLASRPASFRSEFPIVESPQGVPSSGSFDPSLEEAAMPHELIDSGESRPRVVPSSPESQEVDLPGEESYGVVRARKGSWFEERMPSSLRSPPRSLAHGLPEAEEAFVVELVETFDADEVVGEPESTESSSKPRIKPRSRR